MDANRFAGRFGLDGGTIIAFFGPIAIFVGGLACALVAVWFTKAMKPGRGAVVLTAFFLPALFACYLFFVSYLHNEYYRSHGDAFDDGSYSTLPLSNGYKLWYFYKFPWTDLPEFAAHPPLSNVQRVVLSTKWVFVSIGKTQMEDGP